LLVNGLVRRLEGSQREGGRDGDGVGGNAVAIGFDPSQPLLVQFRVLERGLFGEHQPVLLGIGVEVTVTGRQRSGRLSGLGSDEEDFEPGEGEEMTDLFVHVRREGGFGACAEEEETDGGLGVTGCR
jgi:hypothetical protein